MTQRCHLCDHPLTDKDFQDSNFLIDVSLGLTHVECPKNRAVSYGLWTDQFVSQESQYSHQSAGSCTINALETAMRLQIGEKPSVPLINSVLLLASLYSSSMHTGVSDVLPHVTRYKSVLKTIDWKQCNVKSMHTLMDTLHKNTKATKHDVSCVITKPPESILVHKYYKTGTYVLYDSHPRPEKRLNGSHFLLFTDGALLKSYLAILFPFVDLGRGNYGLHGDMMNQCEAHYLQIDYNKWNDAVETLKEEIINNIDYVGMNKDLRVIGFELQSQFLNINEVRNKKDKTYEHKTDDDGDICIKNRNENGKTQPVENSKTWNEPKEKVSDDNGLNESKKEIKRKNSDQTQAEETQNDEKLEKGNIKDDSMDDADEQKEHNGASEIKCKIKEKVSDSGDLNDVGNVSNLNREATDEFVHIGKQKSEQSMDFVNVNVEDESDETRHHQ